MGLLVSFSMNSTPQKKFQVSSTQSPLNLNAGTAESKVVSLVLSPSFFSVQASCEFHSRLVPVSLLLLPSQKKKTEARKEGGPVPLLSSCNSYLPSASTPLGVLKYCCPFLAVFTIFSALFHSRSCDAALVPANKLSCRHARR